MSCKQLNKPIGVPVQAYVCKNWLAPLIRCMRFRCFSSCVIVTSMIMNKNIFEPQVYGDFSFFFKSSLKSRQLLEKYISAFIIWWNITLILLLHFFCLWYTCLHILFFSQEGFRKAMQMVGGEFLDRLEFYQSSWLPARVVVEEAVKRRHQVQAFTIRCSPFYSSGTLWTLLFGVVVLKKDISDTVNVSVNYMNNSSAAMAFSSLCAFLVWA